MGSIILILVSGFCLLGSGIFLGAELTKMGYNNLIGQLRGENAKLKADNHLLTEAVLEQDAVN